MAAETYGPDDTWPEHQMPFWNKALKRARAAGWHLDYMDAPHTYGKVWCPANMHHALVDKTAKGAETKANELEKDVDWCLHGPAAMRSLQALDRAEDLIGLAQQGIARAEMKQGTAEQLDLLENRVAAQLEAAEATLKEVLEAQEEALDAAIAADDAPDPSELAAMVEDASRAAANAALIARELPQTGAKARIVQRVRAAQLEVRALEERLKGLKERSETPDR